MDHELWQRRQRVLASGREFEAHRAMVAFRTGEVPPAAPLPRELAQSSIGERVQERRTTGSGGPVHLDSDDDASQDPDYRPSQD